MPKSRRTFAVVAGTGVLEHFEVGEPRAVGTDYGVATVLEERGGYYVLPRHGPGHRVPPHRINYRANVAALDKLGVSDVIATSAVGSMSRRLGVGGLGLVEQFLDFTKGRSSTFFDEKVHHTDMTNPYSLVLNGLLEAAAKKEGARVTKGLVYVCAEGPRFETAAEIRMFRRLGGDVVGMTGVPEVVLANEKGMRYASVVIATNWAAGMQEEVSHKEVLKVMGKAGRMAKGVIEGAIRAGGGGVGRG